MTRFLAMLLLMCVAGEAALAASAPMPPPRKPHHIPQKCQEIERGVASWYGPGFEGSRTMSEEAFDPQSLSAAHPSLPFGTIVKVTNMRNRKSVVVRVNDRGAFGHQRVIDLSQGAARQIGMIDSGTAPVTIYKCKR